MQFDADGSQKRVKYTKPSKSLLKDLIKGFKKKAKDIDPMDFQTIIKPNW